MPFALKDLNKAERVARGLGSSPRPTAMDQALRDAFPEFPEAKIRDLRTWLNSRFLDKKF